MSEAELIKRAVDLVEKDRDASKSASATPSKEGTIFIEHVGRVSTDVARKIYKSIAAYFGGLTNLDEKQREDRARKAAEVRWGKRKKPKR